MTLVNVIYNIMKDLSDDEKKEIVDLFSHDDIEFSLREHGRFLNDEMIDELIFTLISRKYPDFDENENMIIRDRLDDDYTLKVICTDVSEKKEINENS